ncbi:amidohydrolase family protein [Glaciihabitans sp. dw_435]|uniref:metal-dependent hydrolase family protein n=1 Tax=Glaciihabitans sp. dw_435 TaxID=2720081 RepID=UPI001BD5C373|nr:amidohydrolase family protein [Glaciihabitans sp. dw_435]
MSEQTGAEQAGAELTGGTQNHAPLAGADQTVFEQVRVFDGVADTLSPPTNVVVTANLITAITDERPPDGWGLARIIRGHGRVLMPGLIDAHAHVAFATVPVSALVSADVGYISIHAAVAAADMLQRGFTTVRDAGGPVFGLKLAIDEGTVQGPRIFPAGAFISQTSGHGDFRLPTEVPRGIAGHLTHTEVVRAAIIADGVDEVLRAVREQLMLGASQIKMMAGGGVSSAYDPIDSTQYTLAELQAGVDAAADWGTYVMVHAYTPRAVQRALRAGVRCIEHGHLLDDETVEMMRQADVWWSPQPFLNDEDAIRTSGESARANGALIMRGTDRAYELAIKYGVNLAWGTDTLFDPHLATRQGAQLAKMTRWFTPAETLRMATSENAKLLALSRERNPYPGRLGVVATGALADLLLVDGNPLEDLSLLATPQTSLVAIMKNGELVRGEPE